MFQHAIHVVEPPAPMPGHDGCSHQPSAGEAALLTIADPRPESRVSLIGPNTLELLCALLRHGSIDVSATRVCDRLHAGPADVAVIAHLLSPDCLERAIAHARRVLVPLGTVAIHLAADATDELSKQAGRLLVLHGFIRIRVFDHDGETLIRGELPPHGILACA